MGYALEMQDYRADADKAEGRRQDTIVTAIMNQLSPKGLNGMRAMVGMDHLLWANDAMYGEGIQFRFKGSRQANRAQIYLNAADLYNVRFLSYRKTYLHLEGEYLGIGCEELRGIFEVFTGLRTGL